MDYKKIIVFLILSICLQACTQIKPSRKNFFALGTFCSVTLFEEASSGIHQKISGRIYEIEKLMSVNLPNSDVSLINSSAGIKPVSVHSEVFTVIERALYFAELSEGAFDPTVGPLISLWGIGGEFNPRLPPREEIDAILPLVDWRDVELDRESLTVFLKRPGMALDLGGIAKGYAGDEAVVIVKNSGLKRAVINLGGDVIAYGERQDKSPWLIGIQKPFQERGDPFGILEVRDKAVVTSGVDERYFQVDGVHYHHIFSPALGYPADSGFLSVTIIGGSSMDADAISTAVFVLGYEKGRALVDSLDGIDAVFLFENKSIIKTLGVNFIPADDEYHIK